MRVDGDSHLELGVVPAILEWDPVPQYCKIPAGEITLSLA